MSFSSDQLNPEFSNPDRHAIETPELVAIEMPLAGIGSRFIALLIDTLFWLAGLLVVYLLVLVLGPAFWAFSKLSAQWVTAIYIFLLFLFHWG
ncbi:MAG TPA: hypothetical protein VF742_09085, partial [Terracidiphilus sp.]